MKDKYQANLIVVKNKFIKIRDAYYEILGTLLGMRDTLMKQYRELYEIEDGADGKLFAQAMRKLNEQKIEIEKYLRAIEYVNTAIHIFDPNPFVEKEKK
jgi:hypothetical protein